MAIGFVGVLAQVTRSALFHVKTPSERGVACGGLEFLDEVVRGAEAGADRDLLDAEVAFQQEAFCLRDAVGEDGLAEGLSEAGGAVTRAGGEPVGGGWRLAAGRLKQRQAREPVGGGWRLARRNLAIVWLWFSVVPIFIENRRRFILGDIVGRLIAFSAVVIICDTIQHGA